MSSTLDFRPARRAIAMLAGDSLSITIDVAGIEALVNPVFSGQVRNGPTVVEDFVVDATATGAVLRLTPTQSRALYDSGATQVRVGSEEGGVWEGYYDLQLEHDPEVCRTFLRGPLIIEGDTTHA